MQGGCGKGVMFRRIPPWIKLSEQPSGPWGISHSDSLLPRSGFKAKERSVREEYEQALGGPKDPGLPLPTPRS